MNLYTLSFKIVDIGPLIKQINAADICEIENYTPCECSSVIDVSIFSIKCVGVGAPDVMDVFNRTHTVELSEIVFSMKEELQIIPGNWISDKKAERLYFTGGIAHTAC